MTIAEVVIRHYDWVGGRSGIKGFCEARYTLRDYFTYWRALRRTVERDRRAAAVQASALEIPRYGQAGVLIGALADTHVLEALPELPAEVFELLAECGLILHAGDITDPAVLGELERIAPVLAVQGDHDREAGIRLPRSLVAEVEGHRIGLIHGRRRRPLEVAAALLSTATGTLHTLGLHRHLRQSFGSVDAIVYGHLHVADIRTVDGAMFINPGGVYTLRGDPAYLPAKLSDRAFDRATAAMPPSALKPSLALIRAERGRPLDVTLRTLSRSIRPGVSR